MIHTFWSVKGGSGVTVTAAAYAAGWARRDGPTLLVDLCGDQPAALGRPEPIGAGWTDWLATPGGTADALGRLAVRVDDRLSILPVGGRVSWPSDRVQLLVAALQALPRVVVDAGIVQDAAPGVGAPPTGVVEAGMEDAGVSGLPGAAVRRAGRSTLVVRPCYLALRRAMHASRHADDLIVLAEPERALRARDVAEVLGLDLLTTIDVTAGIARSVDAGVLLRRPNRWIESSLRVA